MLKTTIQQAKELNACSEAIAWAESIGLTEGTPVDVIEKGGELSWAFWLLAKTGGEAGRRMCVELACDFADRVLPIFEAKYPDDKRPRTAIETTRKWLLGEATIEEVRLATYVCASAAYADTYADAACACAYACAYAGTYADAACACAYACASACADAAYAGTYACASAGTCASAAYAAERDWQKKHFVDRVLTLLDGEEK